MGKEDRKLTATELELELLLLYRVQKIAYDVERRTGHIDIPRAGCIDMDEAIQLFKWIDFDVRRIDVRAGGELDTVYVQENGKWSARGTPRG